LKFFLHQLGGGGGLGPLGPPLATPMCPDPLSPLPPNPGYATVPGHISTF